MADMYFANEGEFIANLKELGKLPERHFKELYKKLAFDIYADVIRKTPVDTGRARASWYIDVGRPIVAPPIPKSAKGIQKGTVGKTLGGALGLAISRAKNLSKLDKNPYQIVYITNNQPYILRLEHGYSRQSPAGNMMEATLRNHLNRFQAFLNFII